MGAYADYIAKIDGARSWTPNASPLLAPIQPLTIGATGNAGLWFSEAATALYSALPGDAREIAAELYEAFGSVAGDVSQLVQNAQAIAANVASIAGMVLPYVQAAMQMADNVVTLIEGQQTENDNRRRSRRLDLLSSVELDPSRWVVG